MSNLTQSHSLFTEFDVSLFRSGKHFKLYEKFGSHVIELDGVKGIYFAVWAPNAKSVTVVGNFNGWNPNAHLLNVRWDESGIWEGFIPALTLGEVYKYTIHTYQGETFERGDPYALTCELPPRTASVVTTTFHEWKDEEWMQKRAKNNALNAPISVYEMHLGSWLRNPSEPERFLSCKEIAGRLIDYLQKTGFTHVEFMPVMEHPYYPSWGYQITGFYAFTSRYGTSQDFMYLVEQLHLNDIGVFLDWVPSHFPGDAHGIYQFDGSHLYEHADPRQGYHPDWSSYIFNYGRNEVRSFLISNAFFWLDRYHADGLRVDAVASMLYLDYSRKEGEWIPNEFGGRENLEAVHFLKELNEAVYAHFPNTQTIAEESTSWQGVSKPTFNGGLGFGMKWMMGWMHDSLAYFAKDPLYRKFHHGQLSFSLIYAFHENFMLPFSHDEVVHGKGSMINKMPGDEWQKFANLRALYVFMFTHPGTKLLFMGSEFGQTSEWNFNQSLDWHLLEFPPHKGMLSCVSALNKLYKTEPAMYQKQFDYEGFMWVEAGDVERSIYAYMRKGVSTDDDLLVILNLTPTLHKNYRCALPSHGTWKVIFNSDISEYFGSDVLIDEVVAEPMRWMNKDWSALFSLPPLSGIILKKIKTVTIKKK